MLDPMPMPEPEDDQPPSVPPSGGKDDARRSLLMLLATPVAFSIAFVLGYALGLDPSDENGVGPTYEGAEWLRVIALFVVAALPAGIGTASGVRAVRRGNRAGRIGSVVNGLIVVGLFWVTVGTGAVDTVTFVPDRYVSITASVGAPVRGVSYLGVASSTYGEILVDRDGNTLYTDEWQPTGWNGQLVGSGDPEDRAVWIPFVATTTATVDARIDPARVGAVLRAHGPRQLTYFGHGLYTFVGDTPGAFKPFTIEWSQAAGGGPRWGDRHVISPAGTLLPPPQG